jgi:hypothetical protein
MRKAMCVIALVVLSLSLLAASVSQHEPVDDSDQIATVFEAPADVAADFAAVVPPVVVERGFEPLPEVSAAGDMLAPEGAHCTNCIKTKRVAEESQKKWPYLVVDRCMRYEPAPVIRKETKQGRPYLE